MPKLMSDTATPGARHPLHSVLEEVLGHEHADTLMTYLPAHHSEEPATKADTARLEERFDRVEARFDRLEDRLDRWQRTTLVGQAAMMTAATAVFAAIAIFFT